MYKLHTSCRACGYAKPGASGIKSAPLSERLETVFDLGIQPLANSFCTQDDDHPGYAPLKVLFCPRCGLAQLSVVVSPSILYRHYKYVTSPSATMRDHFETLARDLLTEGPAGAVIEIGSNDGLLLECLRKHDFGNVIGIEPAENLAVIARKRGISTVCDFFNSESADAARSISGSPAFIIARHVFCHVDDWLTFVKSLESIADKETVICIEAPYARDTLDHFEFDQIYHEHLSFLSLPPLKALLENTCLHLHRVIHYPIHGGAILVMIRRNDSKALPHPSVKKYLEDHISLATWDAFAWESKTRISNLKAEVGELVDQGKTIVGYGASAKSTVWINACGFTRKHIRFICDETPQKLYTFSPGSDIPIVDPGALTRELPDYAILFAWNFAEEIIAKEKIFREKGGKWILPVPEIKIL